MRLGRALPALLLSIAMTSAAGCAAQPAPVSQKVQDYYETHKSLPPSAKPQPAKPIAVFIGDSYTQGTGASSGNNWVTVAASGAGLNAVNLGRGGTGYLTVAGKEGCGMEKCPSYPEMVSQAVAAKPSAVVVAGGQNDFQQFARDPERVSDAIAKTYADLRAALPAAKIVAVGPSTPWEVTPDVLAFDKTVQEAAASVKAGYVSLLEPPVITRPMVLQDGAHVNDAGHKAIAERVGPALR
ncbi:SGNH/GDSL hydrolase family protein [Paenarthrobacter sp. NPDC057355]|uniref:SGNH/GDSL hydrolase family protein n=1 Tax=Paenarthrobacter sp. NPDC057355 TaxID=3346105 RepID=UPI00363BB39A